MPTHKLSFTPDESNLPKAAKSFLEQGFMQEDYKSYWIDIEVLIDDLACETIFTGVKLPEKFNFDKQFKVTDIPKEWWRLMKFPPKVERAMKAFWKKHPSGEIEWTWS
jgi:hypothetical protein